MKITSSTVCVGITPDGRAVWKNDKGKPFISVYDAKRVQHLIPVSAFEPIKKPYTYGSLKPL